MKCIFAIFIALALSPIAAHAAEPIASVQDFESQYIKCFESAFANRCWSLAIKAHLTPAAQKPEQAAAITETAFLNWVAGHKVYRVYKGISENKAEIYDQRSYAIERDDGEVMAVWIGLRRLLGQWYLQRVSASSSDEFIASALRINSPESK